MNYNQFHNKLCQDIYVSLKLKKKTWTPKDYSHIKCQSIIYCDMSFLYYFLAQMFQHLIINNKLSDIFIWLSRANILTISAHKTKQEKKKNLNANNYSSPKVIILTSMKYKKKKHKTWYISISIFLHLNIKKHNILNK